MIALSLLGILAFSFVQDVPSPTPAKPTITAPKVKFAPEPDAYQCRLPVDYNMFVLVGLSVDIEGKPKKLHVLRSSNDTCVDKLAVDTVNRYKFAPARKDGVAMPVEMRVEVNVRKSR